MIRFAKYNKTLIHCDESYVGESLEEQIEKLTFSNEDLGENVPMVYTERKDGVQAQYDIRTDRFDVAVQAMEFVAQQQIAKRMEKVEGVKTEDKETIKIE